MDDVSVMIRPYKPQPSGQWNGNLDRFRTLVENRGSVPRDGHVVLDQTILAPPLQGLTHQCVSTPAGTGPTMISHERGATQFPKPHTPLALQG